MRPAMEICVESRAPFEPIGSFSTCTRTGSPSARIFSMGLVGSPLAFLCSQMSATWRNAARSSPISMNADCMPGSTRATRPMQMLPTSPRLAVRSTSSSCTTPALVIATRVSRGVTLMRISSCTRSVQPLDELPGLITRQPPYAGIAAAQMHDEQGGPPLDRVGAGLVVALAARDVLLDVMLGERLEAHVRDREGAFQPVGLLQRDGGEHLVRLAGKRGEDRGGVVAVGGLAQDARLERHGGIGGQHRRLRQLARPLGL